MTSYTLIVPDQTRLRLAEYLESIQAGNAQPGARLASRLAKTHPESLTGHGFLIELLNTKVPLIFAESAVAGDGSDWNLTELQLLGDISVSVPVTVFDNGRHSNPVVHPQPFQGTLVFTPGALLRSGRGHEAADWKEVTSGDGELCTQGYCQLYERRLLPVFEHVNHQASVSGRKALITIPGLGCGQFAGPFLGKLGSALQNALEQFLANHGSRFPNIMAVYYDPFNECSNDRKDFHGIALMVRPLLRGNEGKSQLCQPSDYAEEGDDFSDCELFNIVAWDHVSWPGNDFFGGSRCTDDGVKAAATDSMKALTGVAGSYDPQRNAYLPPSPYRTWEDVVRKNELHF